MITKPKMHNVDVGIRAMIMKAAHERLKAIRDAETHSTGVPTTTMASVGRELLANWTPKLMFGNEAPGLIEQLEGVEHDGAGNRITTRGHRKYDADESDRVPERKPNATPEERVAQLLKHLRKVANPKRGTTLGPIGLVEKAATAEGLLEVRVSGKSLRLHIKAAERAVLKPFRFQVTEAAYQETYNKLRAFNCTVTRALEVGLERFAETGLTTPKE